MSENLYLLCAIGIMSLVTLFLRFAPFLIFQKKTPQSILYLGEVLPYAIMAMLVVYCLKNVSLVSGTHGIPEIIAILLVVGLHKWKHNTLLSILAGTFMYMFLVQVVFG